MKKNYLNKTIETMLDKFIEFVEIIKERTQTASSTNIDGMLCNALIQSVFGNKQLTMFVNNKKNVWYSNIHRPNQTVGFDFYTRIPDLCCISQTVIDVKEVAVEKFKYNINRMLGIVSSKAYSQKYGCSTFIILLSFIERLGYKVKINFDYEVCKGVTILDLILRADSTMLDTVSGKYKKASERWWGIMTEGLPKNSLTVQIKNRIDRMGEQFQFVEEAQIWNNSLDIRLFKNFDGATKKRDINLRGICFDHPDDNFFILLGRIYNGFNTQANFGNPSSYQDYKYGQMTIRTKDIGVLDAFIKEEKVISCAITAADEVSVQFEKEDESRILEVYDTYNKYRKPTYSPPAALNF